MIPLPSIAIKLKGSPLLESLNIGADQASFKGYNLTARGDVWIFPFLNVYGIIGYTNGSTEAKIDSISCTGSFICDLIGEINLPDGAKFSLDLNGGTYGIGTTVAGGVGNWFGLVDLNYTYTSIDAIDGDIKTFIVAPRVGYRWEFDAGRELGLFAGAMYQDVQQRLTGDIASLGLPDELMSIIGDDASFDVDQSSDEEWNTILGLQYSFNRDWNILMEAGFGQRQTYFLALNRRF
ncbi:hypothetical protein L0B53_15795 [Vibrio sp. SS-MA-C1-2]|uniref:hypothetical protein n=1 Tax=Vibrio sp. SS-MA-C1-2 TaxID=2908646 RepID=UPI001F197124|nr:hypothetical protein [Vibrio sp. SS-MA-C1-2]UJF18468.1 hypothetical protein L0B53_15795 [Vibrio sp. SS-MA-C1-2]